MKSLERLPLISTGLGSGFKEVSILGKQGDFLASSGMKDIRPEWGRMTLRRPGRNMQYNISDSCSQRNNLPDDWFDICLQDTCANQEATLYPLGATKCWLHPRL